MSKQKHFSLLHLLRLQSSLIRIASLITKGPFGCMKESEEMESEMVKMESGGKLGNDEKIKFVGPRKSVRWREKTCGSRDICKLHKNLNFLIL